MDLLVILFLYKLYARINIMMNLMINLLKNLKIKTVFNKNKSLIVYVNQALLGFYLCQSYFLQR